MKYKYKNLSGKRQEVIGFGVVGPDEILTTNEPINNPNFELVSKKEKKVEAESKKVKK